MIQIQPYPDTPDEIFGIVKPLLDKHSILIPPYFCRIRVAYVDDIDSPAKIEVHDEYRTADLRIGPTFLNLWGCREHCIIHELMHLYTCPLARAGREAILAAFPKDDDPASKVLYDVSTRAMEACNEDLTQMVLRLVKEPEVDE